MNPRINMNKLAECELAAVVGGAGDGDLPPSYLRPLSYDSYVASILSFLEPWRTVHLSD